MVSTLSNGDRLLVSQLFYTPEQGDIVCFVAKNHQDKILVKRVIATAGQTVDITADKQVTVDGEPLDEPYLDAHQFTEEKSFDLPYTVKEGEVFCMGDNRRASLDCRDLGPVETKHLLGRMILWLMPDFGTVE